ncbi:MAG TPA: HD domain-containing protein [Thermodesulfobacteriota bacterium]|nr:HD domain-containing protein [Thermodesulfobacteriota bacterium]
MAVSESEERYLDSVPFSPEVSGVSLVEHIRFVLKAALFIFGQLEKAHGYKIDRDLLIAAALLHDLGKIFEYRRKREFQENRHR